MEIKALTESKCHLEKCNKLQYKFQVWKKKWISEMNIKKVRKFTKNVQNKNTNQHHMN